jgi:hypothetical protein
MQKDFEKKLAHFFYTTLTPLSRIESPELKAALAVLGAEPPSRRAVSSTLLDEAYNAAVAKVFKRVSEWPLVCVTMDGWKKRACEHGAPLITVVLLSPDGKSHFWKV